MIMVNKKRNYNYINQFQLVLTDVIPPPTISRCDLSTVHDVR